MQSVQALYARVGRALSFEVPAAPPLPAARRIPGAFPDVAAIAQGEAQVLFEKSPALAPGARPLTPQATAAHERRLLCRQIVHTVQDSLRRPPIDVVFGQQAQQACDAAGRILKLERSKQQWRGALQMLKQAAPALTVASLFGQLASPGRVSLGVLAGVVWGTLRFNLSPLLGLHPKAAGDERLEARTLQQKEQAFWAHEALCARLRQAQDRLGPSHRPAASLARPLARAPLAAAQVAVEDLAARLDAARQRHYTVRASLRALGAEAKATATGAQAAVAAATLGLGTRAAYFCTAALAVAFTVGFLHPFASVLGFFFSAVSLAVAAFFLLTNLRRAVHFLDGNISHAAEAPAHTAAKHAALAVLAQQALGKLALAWPEHLADEAELGALEIKLWQAQALEDAATAALAGSAA